jgi:hypothetical protein
MVAKDFVNVQYIFNLRRIRVLLTIPLQQTIVQNRVVIFSKSYCPYCTRAKDLFATVFPDVEVKVLECVSLLCVRRTNSD